MRKATVRVLACLLGLGVAAGLYTLGRASAGPHADPRAAYARGLDDGRAQGTREGREAQEVSALKPGVRDSAKAAFDDGYQAGANDVFTGCRSIVCSTAGSSLTIQACNKPDGGAQFFEMYRQSKTGSAPLQIQLGAFDADSDTVTFRSGELPRGAKLDARTGLFTWTPALNQAGPAVGPRTATAPSSATVQRTL